MKDPCGTHCPHLHTSRTSGRRYTVADAGKLAKGCIMVYVQSLPGVILHCEHAPAAQLEQPGPTGCDETAEMTATGVVRAASKNTR